MLDQLKIRFSDNLHRHPNISWKRVQRKLEQNPEGLSTLELMEKSGGQPDVIQFDSKSEKIIFCDCSPESPQGRRSLCYDHEGWLSRNKHRPESNAITMAKEMGVHLLTEEEYRQLQRLEPLDHKTSSWLLTPKDVRDHGGALFGDFRYGRVFTYHNGAGSYYASRGFRGKICL